MTVNLRNIRVHLFRTKRYLFRIPSPTRALHRQVNGEIRTMSNSEWLRFIYPDNEDLPYVYNEFTWDHCA